MYYLDQALFHMSTHLLLAPSQWGAAQRTYLAPILRLPPLHLSYTGCRGAEEGRRTDTFLVQSTIVVGQHDYMEGDKEATSGGRNGVDPVPTLDIHAVPLPRFVPCPPVTHFIWNLTDENRGHCGPSLWRRGTFLFSQPGKGETMTVGEDTRESVREG